MNPQKHESMKHEKSTISVSFRKKQVLLFGRQALHQHHHHHTSTPLFIFKVRKVRHAPHGPHAPQQNKKEASSKKRTTCTLPPEN
jgi:hypothetical protein